MNTPSKKSLRARKFYLVLPLLILPFITIAFYALGGGKGSDRDKKAIGPLQGLNLNLPNAKLKDEKNADKLSFYEKAEADEKKKEDALKNDPYFKLAAEDSIAVDTTSNELEMIVNKTASKYKPVSAKDGLNHSIEGDDDPHAKAIYDKLKKLENEINTVPSKTQPKYTAVKNPQDGDEFSDNVEKLESMMDQLNERRDGDPEMQKLDGMLNKILEIQHPEKVKEQLANRSNQNKQDVLPVNLLKNNSSISLFGNRSISDSVPDKNKILSQQGFFGSEESNDIQLEELNAIQAVVHETQTLVNGSIIKMRLLKDITLAGKRIPKDNFVYGLVSLSGERLRVEITSIRYNNSIYPVKLAAYDMDGLDGIHIPGAITRDASKQSANEALSMMEMTNLDPSLAAQATSAGISAVKNLLSKKVKLIKVVVKAGYNILLKDNNSK